MKVKTKWFGTVEIEDEKVITFEKGLIGFEECKKYVMLYDVEKDEKEKGKIMWLQSADKTELALPIIRPEYIIDNYDPVVEEEQLKMLSDNIKEADLAVFVTMTVPRDITKMTCNLKAPIIVNTDNMKAIQIAAANDDYEVRFPLYELLKAKKEKTVERNGE